MGKSTKKSASKVDLAPAVVAPSAKTMHEGSKTSAKERGSSTPMTFEATGSKTLFIGNLNLSIEEDDVRDFFKDAGEVDEVGFVMKDDNFLGYGHVEFTTAEAAQKALKLNNELLLDRPVELDLLEERGSSNPITTEAPGSKTLPKIDSAHADVAPSAKTVNKGKRDAEEIVEQQVVGSKKQKRANDGVEQAVEKKRAQKKNNQKEEINSSSESEEEQKKPSVTQDAVKPNLELKEGEDGDSKKSSDDDPSKPQSMKKTVQDAKEASRTDDESEEDNRDDRSVEGDDDQPSKSPKKNVRTVEISIMDTDVEMVDSPSAKKTPQTLITPQATGSKTLFMGNLNFSIEEGDVRDFFKDAGEVTEVRFAMRDDRFVGYAHVEFTTTEAAQEALKLNNALLLDRRVRLDLARERGSFNPITHQATGSKALVKEGGSSTPVTSQAPGSKTFAKERASFTPMTQAPGSKTLFIGNLNFSVEEDDVRNFFKDAGEVADVRFAMREDRFTGYGHVEFTTAEAAQKAIKLNNELLLDRPVRLDFAKERGTNAQPGKENQKGAQAHGQTVYIRGFDVGDSFDSIRSTLEEHFGKCGEISRMSIPKDYESGGPKGVAFIDFADSYGFNKALELNGSEIGGRVMTVEEAKRPRGDSREGSGYGGRSGGRGRFSGGRDGGRGRGGRVSWT